MAETFRLPDLLAMSPWQTGPVNPHLEDEGKASMQWALGYVYDIVKTKHRLEFFEKGQGGLLCAWVYPYASADKFRICCDIMYLVFAVDEFTDVQGGGDAQATMDSVIATFSEDSHDDDSALCLMTRDLKARFLTRCAPIAARRFMHHMLDYLRSVGQEVEHRDKQMLFSVEEYQSLRRDTAGARYSLDLIEFIHDIELPDDIFNHPAIVNVYLAVVDMVCWSNDLYSYNKEQACGHDLLNVISILRREKNLNLQEAVDFVGLHYQELIDTFQSSKAQMPRFGSRLDQAIEKYVAGLEVWAVAHLGWSFAQSRYFGPQHLDIKRSLVVEVYPRRAD